MNTRYADTTVRIYVCTMILQVQYYRFKISCHGGYLFEISIRMASIGLASNVSKNTFLTRTRAT